MAVIFNYSPHAAQLAIHRARGKRFRCVCTGRRFGKTLCLAAELLDRGGSEGGNYGWIAPTYNVAERGVEAFREIAGDYIRVCGRMPTTIEFAGNGGPVRISFLSADNADSIRGYGFRGLVIDEAANIPRAVWNYVIRPTIAQTLGWCVLACTPKGRNWFYDLFARGMDPSETDYAAFTFPSNASPYFPAKEWDEAKRTLPEDVFRQEYCAEFLEGTAGVFRGVDACIVGSDQLTVEREEYHRSVLIGCDVAKHTDWTVLIAMDAATGRCFAMERFNQLDWPIQKERIVAFARKYRGRVIMDATGLGDPIYDDLRRTLPDIEGFKLTSVSKTDLIQRLIVAIEQRRIYWPFDWSILTDELRRYEYQIADGGRLSYGAPAGFHDDCVIALALANHGRWQQETAGKMHLIPGGKRRREARADRRERVLLG